MRKISWLQLSLVAAALVANWFLPNLALASGEKWTQIFPSGTAPSGRIDHTAIYDAANQRMIVFGGLAGGFYRNDVWQLNLNTMTWTQLFPSGTAPSARFDHTAIYDAANQRMIVFGGSDGSLLRNDVWQLNLNTMSWTQLFPSGTAPSGRKAHTAIYDATNQRMIVFGGIDGSYRNDVWQLNLNTMSWTQLFPSGTAPSAHYLHTAIHDAANQRMIVFGGYDGSSILNDVWQLNLNTMSWTQLFPSGTTPSARYNHTAIYDAANQRMIVFGGIDGSYRNDVWQLNLNTMSWTQLFPDGTAPSGRSANTAIYDATNQRMLVFGGYDINYRNDVWQLDLPRFLAITLKLPNGGESWAGITQKSIKYFLLNGDLAHHLTISYSTDGGTSYPNIIADGVSPSGDTYTWMVPNLNVSTARVKIEAKNANNVVVSGDVSDANFAIDSTPPSTFNLTFPANGAWTINTPTFGWQAPSDNLSGIGKYQLWIDGVVNRDSISATSPTTTPSAPLSNGFHTWYVKALDKAGNARQSNQTWTVRIDNAPPSAFNLLSPADSFWTKDSQPTFSWQSSSDAGSGLRKYQLNIDGGVFKDNILASQTTVKFDNVLWADDFERGLGNWITDAPWGLTTSSFHSASRSLTDSPSGTYASNINASVTMSTPITLPRNSSPLLTFWQRYDFGSGDFGAIEISTDGGNSWQFLGSVSSSFPNFFQSNFSLISYAGSTIKIRFRISTDGVDNRDGWYIDDVVISSGVTRLANGSHPWFIAAVDTALNVRPSNQTRVIRIDDTPPSAFNLTAPANNDFTGDTTPLFSWQASSDNGIGLGKYQLWIDGVVKIDSIAATKTSVELGSNQALPDGNHTWYVKAIDKLGNAQQSNLTFTIKVDTQPPAAFSLASPADSAFVTFPTPNFSWNAATDAAAGLSHYQLWIDGVLNLNNITTLSSSPSTPLSEGAHTWFVKAVDRVGNIRQSTQTRVVFGEYSPPLAFDLVSPRDGDTTLLSKPLLTWQKARDFGTGIKKYQLIIDGVVNRDNISPNDTSATPVNSLPNGSHPWLVIAFDRANNQTSSNSTRQLIVNKDITPPSSAISAPTAGAKIGGDSYAITGTSGDGNGTGVAKIEVSLDGGATWRLAANSGAKFSTWQYVWSGYVNGSYTIKSRATDVEGNVETPSAGITITADVTKPRVSTVDIRPNPTSAGTINVTVTFTVGSAGLNFSAVPAVTFTPAGGIAIPVAQTGYNGTVWTGSATIATTEKNGSATISVNGARDNINNLMLPNNNAGTFVIDTVPPRAFNLTAPADSSFVNSLQPAFAWGAATDSLSGLGSYELWIDGGKNRDNIPATATSTTPISNLSLGAHNWFIKAVDRAGNARNSPTRFFRMDTGLPTAQITSPANNDTTGGASITVRGAAQDVGEAGVNRVEVSIDNGPWRVAVNTGTDFSSWTFEWTNPASGRHTLSARAYDRANNIGNPSASITTYVNLAAPTVKTVAVAPRFAKAGLVTITVDFSANFSGMNNAFPPVVSFIPAGSGTAVRATTTSYAGAQWIGTATITNTMNNGTATIRVEGARDNINNTMQSNPNAGQFIIDTVLPQVSRVTPSSRLAGVGPLQLTIVFADVVSGVNTQISPSVELILSNGTALPLTQSGFDATTMTWTGSVTLSAGIADGPASVRVRGAKDRADNEMAAYTSGALLKIDTTPPLLFALIAPRDSVWTKERQPLLQWSASSDATSGLARYQLFINENLNQPAIPPNVTSIKPANPLSDGAYLWKVAAMDSANNTRTSDQTRLLRIDNTPPTSTITFPTPGSNVSGASVTILGSATDGGIGVDSVQVSTDGGKTWNRATNTGASFSTWSYVWAGFVNGQYTLKSRAFDKLLNIETPGSGILVTEVSERVKAGIPAEFALGQNYPNPFNPATTIEFALPRASYVLIEIYNLLGQRVRILIDKKMEVGYMAVKWDGRDEANRRVPTSVYIYRMQAGSFVATRKLVVIQ